MCRRLSSVYAGIKCKRMENIASMYYAELQAKSPTVLACVSNAVNAAKNSGRKAIYPTLFLHIPC